MKNEENEREFVGESRVTFFLPLRSLALEILCVHFISLQQEKTVENGKGQNTQRIFKFLLFFLT